MILKTSTDTLINNKIINLTFIFIGILNFAYLSSLGQWYHLLIFDEQGYRLSITTMILMSISIIQFFVHELKPDKKILFVISALYGFYLTSLVLTGVKSGLFSVINIPVSYFFLFAVIPRYKISKNAIDFLLWLMLFWTIIPIIILPFFSTESRTILISGNFSGFAIHRNLFAVIAGMVALWLLLNNSINNKLRILFLMLILIGIFISTSRSGIFAILISIVYYYVFKRKSKAKVKLFYFFVILSSLFFIILDLMLSSGLRDRTEIVNNEDRFELLQGYYEKWTQSPYFGQGEIYYYRSVTYRDGMPAHNFIFQTLADFGIFVTLAFLILLIITWMKFDINFRTFLLFLIIIGLFQPYFFFGGVAGFSLLVLLIGTSIKNTYDNNIPTFIRKQESL